MGWFSSKKDITDLQKTLIIHLCDSMLGNDNPYYEYHENQMRTKLNLSENTHASYLFEAVNLFEIQFFDAFNFLSKLSDNNKRLVNEVFSYAKNNSNLKDSKSQDDLMFICNKINSLLGI